jgi:hypothetical protein
MEIGGFLLGERARPADGGVPPVAAAGCSPRCYWFILRLPVQRCRAHKMHNILDQCPKFGRPRVKRDLHRIRNAGTLALARSAARRLDDPAWPNAVRTTNAAAVLDPWASWPVTPASSTSSMPSSRGRTETKASAPLFL